MFKLVLNMITIKIGRKMWMTTQYMLCLIDAHIEICEQMIKGGYICNLLM